MNGNKPRLIIGLGNPGAQYAQTRHNLGFMMLDTVAEQYGGTWHDKPKFKAVLAEVIIDGHKAILAKPTTFYNLSGEATAAIAHFYKLDTADILVVHDELDLPEGTIRTRLGGSDAGNNGIKSLIQHLGPNFSRIRLGIASDQRATTDAADFVLSKPGAGFPALADQVLRLVASFVAEPSSFIATTASIKKGALES